MQKTPFLWRPVLTLGVTPRMLLPGFLCTKYSYFKLWQITNPSPKGYPKPVRLHPCPWSFTSLVSRLALEAFDNLGGVPVFAKQIIRDLVFIMYCYWIVWSIKTCWELTWRNLEVSNLVSYVSQQRGCPWFYAFWIFRNRSCLSRLRGGFDI